MLGYLDTCGSAEVYGAVHQSKVGVEDACGLVPVLYTQMSVRLV